LLFIKLEAQMRAKVRKKRIAPNKEKVQLPAVRRYRFLLFNIQDISNSILHPNYDSFAHSWLGRQMQ
jgi:hypothetical protein